LCVQSIIDIKSALVKLGQKVTDHLSLRRSV